MATSLLSTLLFFVWTHYSFWPKSLIYVFYFATSCFTLPTCSTCFIPLSVFLHALFCAFLLFKNRNFFNLKKSLIFPNLKHTYTPLFLMLNFCFYICSFPGAYTCHIYNFYYYFHSFLLHFPFYYLFL